MHVKYIQEYLSAGIFLCISLYLFRLLNLFYLDLFNHLKYALRNLLMGTILIASTKCWFLFHNFLSQFCISEDYMTIGLGGYILLLKIEVFIEFACKPPTCFRILRIWEFTAQSMGLWGVVYVLEVAWKGYRYIFQKTLCFHKNRLGTEFASKWASLLIPRFSP